MALLDIAPSGQEFRFATGQTVKSAIDLYTLLISSPELFVKHVSLAPDLSRNDFAAWIIAVFDPSPATQSLTQIHEYGQFMNALYTLITTEQERIARMTQNAVVVERAGIAEQTSLTVEQKSLGTGQQSSAAEQRPVAIASTVVTAAPQNPDPAPIVSSSSDASAALQALPSTPAVSIDAEIASSLDDEILGAIDEPAVYRVVDGPGNSAAGSPNAQLFTVVMECEQILEPVLKDMERDLLLLLD